MDLREGERGKGEGRKGKEGLRAGRKEKEERKKKKRTRKIKRKKEIEIEKCSSGINVICNDCPMGRAFLYAESVLIRTVLTYSLKQC